MAWLVLGIFYYYHLNGDARSRNLLCLAPFFNLPPYAEREKKQLNITIFCLCQRRESNPGPPVQQANALSITPLPPGRSNT